LRFYALDNRERNTMSKFKEGDKVRFTVDYGRAKKGDLATVRRTDGCYVYARSDAGIDYTALPQRFELVTPVNPVNPANPFKVGDKVRYGDSAPNMRGQIRTVKSLRDEYGVWFEEGGWDYTKYLELVKTTGTTLPNARKTWIISVIIDGKLAPAPTPAEYVSAAQARAVARSMAEKNPGSTFVVFEAVGAAYVAPAPKADFVTL
jgi:hypothetical protein